MDFTLTVLLSSAWLIGDLTEKILHSCIEANTVLQTRCWVLVLFPEENNILILALILYLTYSAICLKQRQKYHPANPPVLIWPPTFPTGTKVVTSQHLRSEASLALITTGATASAWEKRCWFKINVIICHRKPIWLLFLLSCTHLRACTRLYLRMCFHLSSPVGGNRHLVFSCILSHTLGKVKIWVVYTKYLAAFGRQSVCPHQTIDWVSLQQRQ